VGWPDILCCVNEQTTHGLIPESLVERGDLWTIAVNRNQDLLGKTMIVLNRACEAVTELEQKEWLDLHRQIRRLVEVLDVLFHPDLYNFAFLMNQTRQVHLHVVPRYLEPRTWEGDSFSDSHWGAVFGPEQRVLERGQIETLRDAIRSRLAVH
jgi:diadenosine tetraphosphate (Ap4A) HIT family hydrolase